ncbi:MAG: hypothetical protein AAF412_15170 [Pseudomonadota bacterium]
MKSSPTANGQIGKVSYSVHWILPLSGPAACLGGARKFVDLGSERARKQNTRRKELS